MATRREAAHAGRRPVAELAADAERQVVAAYARAWRAVAAELEAAALDAARHIGDVTDPAAGWRMHRVRRLVAALAELERLAADAGEEARQAIAVRTPRAVLLGSRAPIEVAAAVRQTLRAPVPSDLAAIVARSTDRITADFDRLPAFVRTAIGDQLTRGVATQVGTEAVARRLRDNAMGALGRGLDRARVIARTELLDASRLATRDTYLANPGVVVGWRWLAALGPRTCPACFAMHDTIHRPDETLDGHPQCRCVAVPILAGEGVEASSMDDPAAAFARLDRPAQLAIMGPSRLTYLEAGGDFSALAVRQSNPGWRPAYVVRPVRDLPMPARAAAA